MLPPTYATPRKLADALPLGIASMNLGRAAFHELEPKLSAAAAAGFKGVEVFYEDIKIPARRALAAAASGTTTFQDELIVSAQNFRNLCDKYNLTIFVFQPFKNYDGLLSQQRHDEKIEKLKHWFKLAKILRTDTIQIPSMFHRDPTVATGDMDKIVADLVEVADLGAKENPPIRFAYEIMAWGAHVDRWQQAWKITQMVNRDNFGMCLDTYQILANIWADCTSESGVLPNADKILQADMDEFLREVPLEKVYYVQLADAARMSPPLSVDHEWYDPKQKWVMTWSRNARLFPFEEDRGGYLPVLKMLEMWIFDWGYRGWVSMELFNRSMMDPSPSVPKDHAERGVASWNKCVKALKLDERDA